MGNRKMAQVINFTKMRLLLRDFKVARLKGR